MSDFGVKAGVNQAQWSRQLLTHICRSMSSATRFRTVRSFSGRRTKQSVPDHFIECGPPFFTRTRLRTQSTSLMHHQAFNDHWRCGGGKSLPRSRKSSFSHLQSSRSYSNVDGQATPPTMPIFCTSTSALRGLSRGVTRNHYVSCWHHEGRSADHV